MIKGLSVKFDTRDDKGFSLVELIICIAILAIATVPLYRSMALSAKTNASAQSKQNATSLAEAVMEEIKATSIDELKSRYNGESLVDGKVTPNEENLGKTEAEFWIDDTKNGVDRGVLLTSYSSDVMLTGSYTDKPFYVLYKPDAVSTQGEKFNVIASIRTSPYMGADNTDASDANSKKLPRIEEIDALSQAVISSKEFTRYDTAALDYFRQDGVSHDLSVGIAQREIFIDKSDTAGSLYDQVSVDCRVVYKSTPVAIPGSTETKIKTYSRDLFSGTYGQPVKTVVDGSSTSTIRTELKSNIYLFYKRTQMPDPDAPGVTVTIPAEKITITDNATKGTHKVYLVMQDALTIGGTVVDINSSTINLDENSDLDANGNIVSSDGKYELITNMMNDGASGHIYNEEAHIRIYDVDISLVRDGTEYAHLHSTKEAND